MATLLGPAIVGTGGWWLGAVLIAFFVSSALLPNASGENPARTWQQVLANGGPALAFAALSLIGYPSPFLLAAAATIAATTSDTWATEVGRARGGSPYSVRTWHRVPPGTSGAISAAGTIASIGGAGFIAVVASILAPAAPTPDLVSAGSMVLVAASGALGSTADTILGATLQARFRCGVCGHTSESPAQHCPGHPMRHASGVPWMTNSVVNLFAALIAGVITASVAIL